MDFINLRVTRGARKPMSPSMALLLTTTGTTTTRTSSGRRAAR